MSVSSRLIAAVALAAALSGCKSTGDIVVSEGVGISSARSACPAVGIPDYTGDVTLFRVPGDTTAGNVDLVAAMTNVRSQCNELGDKIQTTASFDVLGRRSDTRGARSVTLPYFVTVLRGGRAVVTKRIGQVTLDFADGQDRARASASGSTSIDRAEATLPEDIRRRLLRKRKAGDQDAAVDPLSQPDVKAAVQRATFELLVGFQLDDKQLTYNVTR